MLNGNSQNCPRYNQLSDRAVWVDISMLVHEVVQVTTVQWSATYSLSCIICKVLTLFPEHHQLQPFSMQLQRQSRAQTPPSHEEKGLVTIERFLGCADSAVLIFERTLITCLHDVRLFHWLMHMLG